MEQDRQEKKARSDALREYTEVKLIEAQNALASIELERSKSQRLQLEILRQQAQLFILSS
ncbi:hypothetical protein V1521DRAFT_438270 [Lipomyces starkeyi]